MPLFLVQRDSLSRIESNMCLLKSKALPPENTGLQNKDLKLLDFDPQNSKIKGMLGNWPQLTLKIMAVLKSDYATELILL